MISTPCTSSMITSFTPCINFVTGSSSNGTSPAASCCGALKELVAASMDCACLLVTANVPIQLPFGGPLSIPLPRPCKMAVPLRCKGTSGSPLPAPGPAIFGPSSPPSPSSPQGILFFSISQKNVSILSSFLLKKLAVVYVAASAAADAPASHSTGTLPLSPPAISPEAGDPTDGTLPFVNTSESVSSHDVPPAAFLLITMAIILVTYNCF
ncbi:unnamed protein product [Linum tenue]|uniref:Bifunctional inhibitor/plant lipid transfer protein/seed storage helical domain-containing protein n=1 Tax=Linum tenue TaxID=586396 RepID=A0AAV0LJC5_9ROSI|nr:unnamed protein product [Linum tenue]